VRRALRWLGIGLVGLALALGSVFALAPYADGPIGPIPGGPMSGRVRDGLRDVSALASRRSLELQVNPRKPRARTVWLLVLDGSLYVPAAFAARKRWPGEAVADGRVVIRVDGDLYERQAVRVTDPSLRASLFEAMTRKYAAPAAGDPRTWFFRLDPRPAS
jgi:hypothetical protein